MLPPHGRDQLSRLREMLARHATSCTNPPPGPTSSSPLHGGRLASGEKAYPRTCRAVVELAFGFLEFLGVNSRACIVELVCPATERPAAAKLAAAQQGCHVSTGVACGSPGGRPKPRPQGLASVHRLCHTAAELSTRMHSMPGAPPCFFLDLSSRRPSFDYTLHGDVDLTVSKE